MGVEIKLDPPSSIPKGGVIPLNVVAMCGPFELTMFLPEGDANRTAGIEGVMSSLDGTGVSRTAAQRALAWLQEQAVPGWEKGEPMNKIFLAFTFFAAGAGAFEAARQHANQLEQKAQAASESWQIHTQQLAAAQSESAVLTERVRWLKHAQTQSQTAPVSALWSELQTNRTDALPPDLRRRLLAELGFEWRTSPDYVIVSKGTVRDLGIEAVRGGKLTDLAATVLALTTDERGQIESALAGITTPLKDWLLAHIERHEPTEELLADFNLPVTHPGEQPMSQQISNDFAFRVSRAVWS